MNYFALVTKTSDGYAATVPELRSVLATEDTLDTLKTTLAEGIAYFLHEAPNAPIPKATTLAELPQEIQEDYAGQEVIELLIEPAPINPVSLEVQRAIEQSGLSYREVARQMGTGHAAISRMADLFYWGHSLSALRKLTDVLGKQVSVSIWDEKAGFTDYLFRLREAVKPQEDRLRAGTLDQYGHLRTHWRAIARDNSVVNFDNLEDGLIYPYETSALVILKGTDEQGRPAALSGHVSDLQIMAIYDGFEPKDPSTVRSYL